MQNSIRQMLVYLKLDTTLLADVFENFRDCIYQNYQLDPVYYLTLSSLGLDSALKLTKQELDLFHDSTMFNFVKKGIYGGLSMVVKRYAKANNPDCPSYDSTLPKSYIFYVDANNLYGWAMMQDLPVSNFEWLDVFPKYLLAPELIPDNCILDVNIHCPEELHDKFKDYPLCPTHEKCSEKGSVKLVTTFYKKEHYIVHAKYLKFALKHGYILTKIHKILGFESKPWLKPFIEKNTKLRSQATSEFGKDLWKLFNNSCFGKQIENVDNRTNIKFETDSTVDKYTSKPYFKNIISLETEGDSTEGQDSLEGQYLLEMAKLSVTYDKPIYGGLAILAFSKILMGQFFYEYLQPKFGDRLELLYTDTDSFMLEICSDDLHQEILPDIPKYFDTSNYPKEHYFPKVNKKIPGLFKDQMAGGCITEYVGTRAKQYAYETIYNDVVDTTKKCKGINKVAMKTINFDDYYNSVFHKKTKDVQDMKMIRSKDHINYTISQNKRALDPCDEKRQILANGVDTLPWGYA